MTKDLITNEIKDRAGAEVEFTQISVGPRESQYKAIAEVPAYPNRLTIKHSESGSGFSLRRRSLVRFDKSVQSAVDTTKTVVISVYAVADLPVGAINNNTQFADVVAYLNSFMASLGVTTTILYDGTGNGSRVVLNGEI
jgi:hypothetical protein